jgi:predicted CXXCH cytochrome family protein
MDRVRLLTLTLAYLIAVGSIPAIAGDQCRTCHEALGDRPSSLFKSDVHASSGISCADCHGGNPRSDDMEAAMSKDARFIGVPKSDGISNVCASCHSNPDRMQKFGSKLPTGQWDKLQQSIHGKPGTSGGTRIAQCTACHPAHGVLSKSNPRSPVYPLNVVATCTRCHSNAAYMRSYNPALAVDQLDKYRTSVHGMLNAKGDSKVAECASCHGSHDILPHTEPNSHVYAISLPHTCARCHSDTAYMKEYRIPTDQYDKYARSVHGIALLQKKDVGAPACNSCHGNHGATPPGVESISMVCGTCHALNAEMFAGSPHKKAFDQRKLPECATCHGNHEIIAASDALLGTSKEAVCSRCHSPQENARGYAAAGEMRRLIDSLETLEGQARSVIADAEQKGMEVTEPKFKMREIRQARLESKTVIHSFDAGRVRETVSKGLAIASNVKLEGETAVDQYYFRRLGLGISTLVITVLAVALGLYIRRLERVRAHSGPSRHSG